MKGNRILTMYSGDYGTNVLRPKGWKFPVWLAFMQTGDNVGVQSGEYILECKNKVGKDTKFITGTLDDFAEEIYKCDLSGLKVIRGEMSDSWIHGAGTYPDAMSEYKRDLCKFKQMKEYAKSVGADISREEDEFYRAALIFAEHTFGINVLKFFGKEVTKRQIFRFYGKTMRCIVLRKRVGRNRKIM